MAIFHKDYRRMAELHVEAGWMPSNVRIDELEAAARSVCEPYFTRPLSEISLAEVLIKLFRVAQLYELTLQPQLILLQKTLLNIEGLGRQLDPELDLWATAKPFLERWMNEQVGWPALNKQLQKETPRFAQFIPELPRLLHDALKAQARRGGDADLKALVRELRSTNRLLAGLVWAGVGFSFGVLLTWLMARLLGIGL